MSIGLSSIYSIKKTASFQPLNGVTVVIGTLKLTRTRTKTPESFKNIGIFFVCLTENEVHWESF